MFILRWFWRWRYNRRLRKRQARYEKIKVENIRADDLEKLNEALNHWLIGVDWGNGDDKTYSNFDSDDLV